MKIQLVLILILLVGTYSQNCTEQPCPTIDGSENPPNLSQEVPINPSVSSTEDPRISENLGSQTVTITPAPSKCSADEYQFNQLCVPLSCKNDQLERIQAIKPSSTTEDIGLFYVVTPRKTPEGLTNIDVLLKYHDTKDDQLISDPENCLDWQVYQTKNSQALDPARLQVNQLNSVAVWPHSAYSYLDQGQLAIISFSISQKDLDDYGCLRFKDKDQIQWECFFELAFILQHQSTVLSYYFSIKVQLDDSVSSQTLPNVEILRMISVHNCDNLNAGCSVEVQVPSQLEFCEDRSCSTVSSKPYFELYVSKLFYLKHSIIDPSFQSFLIQRVQISFQTYGFSMVVSTQDLDVVESKPGYNIYALQIPIVASNVLIGATGDIVGKDNRRILAKSSSSKATNTKQSKISNSTNTGAINAPNYTLPNCTKHDGASAFGATGAILLIVTYMFIY